MSTITTKDGTQIYYKDWGTGQPIVFSHGWPLSADEWDAQMLFFLNHGYRVIAHDRRGHGHSSQSVDGHDMDHYADDVAALAAQLDLKFPAPSTLGEHRLYPHEQRGWTKTRKSRPALLRCLRHIQSPASPGCLRCRRWRTTGI
jgi:non-heme chloroperoxidase